MNSKEFILFLLTLASIGIVIFAGFEIKETKNSLNLLQDRLNELNLSYTVLRSRYEGISTAYDELRSRYEELSGNYSEIFGNYSEIRERYFVLSKSIEKLKGNYTLLISSYNELVREISGELDELSRKIETISRDQDISKIDEMIRIFHSLNESFHELISLYSRLSEDYSSLASAYQSLASGVPYEMTSFTLLDWKVDDLKRTSQLYLNFSASRDVILVLIGPDGFERANKTVFSVMKRTYLSLDFIDTTPKEGKYLLYALDYGTHEVVYRKEISLSGPELVLLDYQVDWYYWEDWGEFCYRIVNLTLTIENGGDLPVYLYRGSIRIYLNTPQGTREAPNSATIWSEETYARYGMMGWAVLLPNRKDTVHLLWLQWSSFLYNNEDIDGRVPPGTYTMTVEVWGKASNFPNYPRYVRLETFELTVSTP